MHRFLLALGFLSSATAFSLDRGARNESCQRNMSEYTIFETLEMCPELTHGQGAKWLTEETTDMLHSEDGSYTLFHPTTRAIMEFYYYFHRSGKPITKDYVDNIIALHIVDGAYAVKDFAEGANLLETYQNNTEYVNLGGDGQAINVLKTGNQVLVSFGIPNWPRYTARVVRADICCKNGIIHFIDKVMWFPSFTGATLKMAKLNALMSAAGSVGLQATLDTGTNFTFFVPSNAVLEGLLGGVDVDPATIKQVVLTHMAHGTFYSTDLGQKRRIKMLNGKTVEVFLEDHTVRVGGAKVLTRDVLLRNGVMHVIDNVLRPTDDDDSEEGSGEEGASKEGGSEEEGASEDVDTKATGTVEL